MTDAGGGAGFGDVGGPSAAYPARGYPARFVLDPPSTIVRWKPLVQWLLAIPQLLVLNAMRSVAQILSVISWFAILFTGRLPAGIADFQGLYVRYWLRTYTYVGFLREEYPPFAFVTTPTDPGGDPRVGVDVAPDLGNRNRVTTGFRLILAIPHIIVLALLAIAAVVVGVIAFFAVIFTGRWPAGMRDFVLGVARWWLRLEAYLLLLTDEYPPFTLDDLPLALPPSTI
jgi:Domain of unknown function (DUF4389)